MKSIAIAAFIVMAIGLFLDAFLVVFSRTSPHLGWGEIAGLIMAFVGAVVASVAGTLYRRKVIRR
jgi:hypothetical protein